MSKSIRIAVLTVFMSVVPFAVTAAAAMPRLRG